MSCQVGIIGCGNLAGAVVRGWNEPVLRTDIDMTRAVELARVFGGEAVESNAELARRADLVVLCHKPKQLNDIAREIGPQADAIVSLLGSTPLADVQAAYPNRPVYRLLPSLCAEIHVGSILSADAQALEAEVHERFGRLGDVAILDDVLVDTAMALTSNSPAFYALIVEAQVDAGIRNGIPSDKASAMVLGAMAGTAALLDHQGGDTLRLRRAVTSPGGSTARGVDVLERTGLRASLSAALDAVLR